jgi:hypothetical protein
MSRRFVAFIPILVAIMALPTGSGAHTVSSATKISKAKLPRGTLGPGQRVIVFGRLTGLDPVCESGRPVQLMRRVPGNDRVLQTDMTDTEGEYYFLRRPRGDQRLYVRFVGLQEVIPDHLHSCAASVSAQFDLKVSG